MSLLRALGLCLPKTEENGPFDILTVTAKYSVLSTIRATLVKGKNSVIFTIAIQRGGQLCYVELWQLFGNTALLMKTS